MAKGYPIRAYSWEVLTDRVAIKRMDKSAFLHHGTAIPKEICFFFDLTLSAPARSPKARLVVQGISYAAHFQKALGSRYRLFWKSDLSNHIRHNFPGLHRAYLEDGSMAETAPIMRFEKLEKGQYLIDFFLPGEIVKDVRAEDHEEAAARPEGALKEFYGKRYERDPRNRRTAIEYHGLRCKVCGFSFSDFYGARGEGFIEIHHIKPLGAIKKREAVNPITDLLPVCANCHRMIHRRIEDVLSIEELQQSIIPPTGKRSK